MTKEYITVEQAEEIGRNHCSAIYCFTLLEFHQAMNLAAEQTIARIISTAESLGWGMKNDDPFEDAVREVCNSIALNQDKP